MATPKNISYFWGFGRLLGFIIIAQTISGVFLAFYYVSGHSAWDSVVEIVRETSFGWLLRLVHRNGASFMFVIMFVHFFRGVIYCSFYLKLVWLRGWLILFFSMASAFLGYVLPWGQMSFWGATVIINLLSILPRGKLIVIWLWGGFYVSYFTSRFFFAIHFIIPLIVIIIIITHLTFLHFIGSCNPVMLDSNRLKLKFKYFFLYKDVVNLIILWIFWSWCLIFPNWSADPVNFISSDLSNSPLHIQPEWYFLHFYAILRSIPNKLGGLIGFIAALFLIALLAFTKSNQLIAQLNFYKTVSWSFIYINMFLLWIGIQVVEQPFIKIGQILTSFYFLFIGAVFFFDLTLVLVSWRFYRVASSYRIPSG